MSGDGRLEDLAPAVAGRPSDGQGPVPLDGQSALHGHAAGALASVLMAYVALQTVGVALIPAVTPLLRDRFAITDARIGLLTSAFALAVALSAVAMGLATARWGGQTLFAAAALFFIGSLVFAAAGSYEWLLAGRFIQGLGAGAGMPVGTALITRLVTPSWRHCAFGLFGAGTGLGTVGTLLVAPSIATAGGYRAVFVAAAGFAVVLAAAAAAVHPLRTRIERHGDEGSVRALGTALAKVAVSPRILLIAVMNLTVVAVVVGVLTWTPQFLHDAHGSTIAVAAYLTAGIGVAQAAGNPLGAAGMARWGKMKILLAGLVLMAVATALIPAGAGLVAAFVAVIATVLFAGAVLPPSLAIIADVAWGSEEVGAATGFIGLVNVIGSMLAPWVFGLLLDVYGTAPGDAGYTLGYAVLAGFGVAGALAAVAYVILPRRP